ncbi:hypothetical protein [Belliella pelovolcani]|uniref:hypothetical protein n=1 Tax=Belliella pelovolcani TaxID=529505 RepID=UPI00391A2300
MELLLYLLLLLLCALGALIIVAFKLQAYSHSMELAKVRLYELKYYEINTLDIVPIIGTMDVLSDHFQDYRARSRIRMEIAIEIAEEIIKMDLMETRVFTNENDPWLKRIECKVRLIPQDKNNEIYNWNLPSQISNHQSQI